jgi:A/G-specific adenine glycosylase
MGAGSRRRTPPPGPGATDLLRWFRRVRRPLPWRANRDPYRIWVAEVLLQQTRVAQAVPYYRRFLRRFPSVRALARARQSEVLKAWEGAGYYARARHLHAAARVVVARHRGKIPGTVEELERLPGVGPYIARAVASLAFGRPVVAIEANGLRVAARWTLERGALASSATRIRLERALADRLPRRRAGEFNEAVMELGETVCTPVAPHCEVCPVAISCRAFRELADPSELPRRPPRRVRPQVRAAIVVLIDRRGRWLLQRRAPSGFLGGLWEFPGGKIDPGERPEAAARRELREETGFEARDLVPAGSLRHTYSHFSVELHVFRARPTGPTSRRLPAHRRWVRPNRIAALPIPKATEKVVRRLVPSDGAPGAR